MADAASNNPPPGEGLQGKKVQKQGLDYLQYLIKYFKACGLVLPIWLIGYFNFSPSWVLLGLFGYLLGEEYKKVKNAKIQYARSAVLNEKEAILARVEDLPSWVFFPDVERAEWLNKMIKQMWPYIGEYAKDLLKTTVEPAVQNSLPNSLKPFKFETIDLGDIPPRIGGVKVYIENVKRDEIIMDFEIFYSSDSQIKVAIRGLTAGIKDLTIHGHMRVVMKPLVRQMPIIGGLHVFFLNQPNVDFDLTNTANMLDVPLLSNTVRGIIVDQISYYMVLPNKLPVQLAQNIDAQSFKYPMPAGVVRLHIVGARELKAADIRVIGKAKSDPYCKLYVGAQVFKTKVIENSIQPTWNAYFEAIVDQNKGQFVDIDVLDEDPGEDDELGCCSVDLENVANNGSIDTWLPLENVKTGMVHVRALWLHLSKDPNDLDRVIELNRDQALKTGSDDMLSSAMLMVTLDSAKELPRSKKSMSEPSPYVKLSLGNLEKKSVPKHKTTDPKWEEKFIFLIHDPRHQDLDLRVIDSNKDKKLGTLTIPISTVLSAPDMILHRPYQLRESGGQSKLILRLALRVLTSELPEAWARDDLPVAEANVPQSGTNVDTGTGDMQVEDVSSSTPAAPAKPTSPARPASLSCDTADTGSDDNISMGSSHLERSATLPTTGTELRQRSTGSTVSTPGANLGSIQVTIRYSEQRQKLICVIHKCVNLVGYDENQLSDPYVRIYLLPDSKSSKRKTQTVKDDLNPIYDETFDWGISLSEAQTRSLDIMVKNKNSFLSQARTEMGSIIINLSQLDLTKAFTEWYDLQDPDSVNKSA